MVNWTIQGTTKSHRPPLRCVACLAMLWLLWPSAAPAVECGEFNGDAAHMVDDANVVVGGRWLERVDGKWIDRSRDCERERVSAVVRELEERGDWATVAGEGNKRALWVSFDGTCGYCRKLHTELDAYAAAGFEVRYLGYPRAGIQSEAALDLSDYGLGIEAVRGHLAAGRRLGLSGTPMLIIDGRIVRGYVPAGRLAGVSP